MDIMLIQFMPVSIPYRLTKNTGKRWRRKRQASVSIPYRLTKNEAKDGRRQLRRLVSIPYRLTKNEQEEEEGDDLSQSFNPL
mgnify:CR=1 FL=1